MAKKGLARVPIAPLIIIVIGIVVVLYILKNKNLFKFVPVIAGAAIAIGESVFGPNVYPVVGPIAPTDSSRMTICSNGTSFRDNQGFDCSKCNSESTWFLVPEGESEEVADCYVDGHDAGFSHKYDKDRSNESTCLTAFAMTHFFDSSCCFCCSSCMNTSLSLRPLASASGIR